MCVDLEFALPPSDRAAVVHHTGLYIASNRSPAGARAGELGLIHKAGVEALSRGSHTRELAGAHGSFLVAMCLRGLLEEGNAHCALAPWCAACSPAAISIST